MKNDFNLCPMCGSKKIVNHGNRKWLCSDCGFDLYCNVAAAVGVVIYDDERNVLFEIRAKNPKKGFACLPGGFVDFDESAEEAIVRECREELGMQLGECKYLCSFPNVYEYKNIEYRTCDIFFMAKLPSEFKNLSDFIKSLKMEESEVQNLVTYRVDKISDIDKIPLAFGSAVNTLKTFVNNLDD